MSKIARSTHTSRQHGRSPAAGSQGRVELQLRPAGSHGYDHSGCDGDEQDAGIQLTSRGSGERLQPESLDCSGGVELEDAATAAVLLGSCARRDGGRAVAARIGETTLAEARYREAVAATHRESSGDAAGRVCSVAAPATGGGGGWGQRRQQDPFGGEVDW